MSERAGKCGQKYKRCELFWRAIQKYGWDNFVPSILEVVHSFEESNKQEQYWIQYYDSTNREKGYNLYSGGLNHKATEEAKKHMSKAQKSRPPITEETRKKMSESHKGKNSKDSHYLWGGHLSEETKQKISDKLSDGLNPAARKI